MKIKPTTPRKRKRQEGTLTEKALAYFEPIEILLSPSSNKTHTCKLCKEHYNAQTQFNLVNHLMKAHGEIYETLIEQKESPAIKRLKLLQYCTEIVSVNGRPFEYLHDSGFQKIVQKELAELKMAGHPLNLSDHGLKEVKDNLKQTAHKIRGIISEEVKGRSLSLLVDAVTKQKRSILGFSIQYTLNGQLKIRSIGMVELTQKHTGKYLAEVIIKRLEELGIKLCQIITITTDNGANVLKMVRDLDEILQTEIDKATQPAEQQKSITDMNFDALRNEDNLDAEIDELLANTDDLTDDEFIDMIIHETNNETLLNAISVELENSGANFSFDITGVNCTVHTLQLAIKGALEKMPKRFQNIIELCRIVCKVIRLKSCEIEMIELNIPYKKPHLENATRWGSMFLMVCLISFKIWMYTCLQIQKMHS